MFFILLSLCSLFISTYGGPCPPGALYVKATAKCYHFIDKSFPFSLAENYCVNETKGHLLSINNAYEMTVTKELATSAFPNGVQTYWIGGKLFGNRPQWTNGNAFTYSNWKNGSQTNALPISCIQLSIGDSGWSLADCAKLDYFVCESPSTKCCSCNAKRGCESGWKHLPLTQSCYKVIDRANWHDAEHSCVKQGAHLASIHSEAENDFIFQISFPGSNDGYQNVWIGLSNPGRAPHASNFVWSDGSPMKFTKWIGAEPNNANGNEYCTQFYSTKESIKDPWIRNEHWNDCPCSRLLRAVCKKPATFYPE